MTLPLREAQKVLRYESQSCVVVLRGLNRLPFGGLQELVTLLTSLARITLTIILPVRKHMPKSSCGVLKERPASTGFIVLQSEAETKRLLSRGSVRVGTVDVQLTDYVDRQMQGVLAVGQGRTALPEGLLAVVQGRTAPSEGVHAPESRVGLESSTHPRFCAAGDYFLEDACRPPADSFGLMPTRWDEDQFGLSSTGLERSSSADSSGRTSEVTSQGEMLGSPLRPYLRAPVLKLPQYGFLWNG